MAEIVLVIIIAVLSARLFWVLFAPLPTPVGAPVRAATMTPGPSAAGAKNPFSTPAPTGLSKAENASAEELSETSLDLTLFGTWLDDSGGTAFIGLGAGPQKRYRQGDLIADGARLVQIHRDWVAISRAGATEALRLKNRKDRATTKAPPVAAAKPGRVSLDEAFLFAVDNTRAAGAARIVLNPGPQADVFAALGFAPGDILVAIDGKPIDVGAIASGALADRLIDDAPMRATIERDGVLKVIDVDLSRESGRRKGG